MVGVFVLFGLGQFSNLYLYLMCFVVDSKFYIVGEVLSVYYVWIVGVFDSVVVVVLCFFKWFELCDQFREFEEKWEGVEELEIGVKGILYLQVVMGMLREKNQVKV